MKAQHTQEYGPRVCAAAENAMRNGGNLYLEQAKQFHALAVKLEAENDDLLDALDELYSKCADVFKQSGFPASFHAGIHKSTIEKTRSAIAKARGES